MLILKILYFVIILSSGCSVISAQNSSENISNSWITFTQEAKKYFKTCSPNLNNFTLSCFKKRSLDIFDKMASSDVIPLTDSTRLVRYRHKPYDSKGHLIRRIVFYKSQPNSESTWSQHIIEKIADLLTTHVFQMDLYNTATGTARRRHHNQMLPMMVFGVTALGMVVVPIGFQFLAMLGGKALLLSKMALLLASVNGLKRIATSGVHYGLYHTDPYLHNHHGYLDRGDQFQHPRG